MAFHRCMTMSRPALRKQLGMKFSTDDAFDGFCLDYFPDVYTQFSGEMSRLKKENILLQRVSEAALTASLCMATCSVGSQTQPIVHPSIEKSIRQTGYPCHPRDEEPPDRLEDAVIIAVLPRSTHRRTSPQVVGSSRDAHLRALNLTSLLALIEGVLSRPRSPVPIRRCTARTIRRRR